MAVDKAIVLEGLGKSFAGVAALQQLDIGIAAGRVTGLVGPDGAGKTTLMRILAGLMKPSAGHASVAGLNVASQAAQISHITGYMPQRFGLYEDLSVLENLRLYSDLRNVPGDSRAALFRQLLGFTGLDRFSRRLAGRLSGGMKQKLGLACALMSRPEVLLLDEPSVGVDALSRQELWAMVKEMAHEGMTVLWSTSYLDEAERCDDVILLDDGRLAYAGRPGDLSSRVRGRSFLLHVAADRRGVLLNALNDDAVRDGVIQGNAVRLVVAEDAPGDSVNRLAGRFNARVEAVSARFEDAYIDLLGGGPGGHSAIAERMQPFANDGQLMVECRDLTKRFGDFIATDRISFQTRRGEIMGLLGPNGAGKSTTFKMLCGLLRPDAGEARVAGFDLRHSTSSAKMRLGYMAQKFSLYGLMSVRQNLEFFSGVYGLQGKLRRERIREMVDVFELKAYLDESPDVLPLGFKQRLALACALMHRPEILFLDEPTSGVDPITRREFWTHITGLVEKGITVLVTTHFMDEAEYCDQVALVNRSQLIALDTPDALKAAAATRENPQPTMEEAFIKLVAAQNAQLDMEQVA